MNTVADLLDKKARKSVYSITPEASVFEAIELMAKKGIGALLVLKEEQIVGLITERDYARKVILAKRSSKGTPVEEIMQRDVTAVSSEAPIDLCRKIMTDEVTRHLPVIDNGVLVGLISMGDIVAAMIEEKDFLIDQLHNYIAGTEIVHHRVTIY